MNELDKRINDLTISLKEMTIIQGNTIKNVEKLTNDLQQLLKNVASRELWLELKHRQEKTENEIEAMKDRYTQVLWKFFTFVSTGFVMFILAELGIKYALP